MTEQEIKDILQQQNHFFSSGKTIPAEFRLKQLESLKEAMIRHEADLAAALKEDFGVSCNYMA
jgi:acyl-CoA reductase-like NAD-dependent aldehyde dehydrogenase